VGNVGAADVSASSVTIDTQVPTVTAMAMSGVDNIQQGGHVAFNISPKMYADALKTRTYTL